jgi:hypothetical protein
MLIIISINVNPAADFVLLIRLIMDYRLDVKYVLSVTELSLLADS